MTWAGGQTIRKQPEPPAGCLLLANAAAPETLAQWLASAAPRSRAVYATGADLPMDAAGVKLARRWAADGKVHLFRERDPANPAKFNFLIEKASSAAAPAAPVPAIARAAVHGRAVDRGQLHDLLALLRHCAERGKPCPSNADLARELGLPVGKRGNDAAQYLLTRLVREHSITVESRGTMLPRVVTILAAGRAKGKRTAE